MKNDITLEIRASEGAFFRNALYLLIYEEINNIRRNTKLH